MNSATRATPGFSGSMGRKPSFGQRSFNINERGTVSSGA
jgi:hypothetical protein